MNLLLRISSKEANGVSDVSRKTKRKGQHVSPIRQKERTAEAPTPLPPLRSPVVSSLLSCEGEAGFNDPASPFYCPYLHPILQQRIAPLLRNLVCQLEIIAAPDGQFRFPWLLEQILLFGASTWKALFEILKMSDIPTTWQPSGSPSNSACNARLFRLALLRAAHTDLPTDDTFRMFVPRVMPTETKRERSKVCEAALLATVCEASRKGILL